VVVRCRWLLGPDEGAGTEVRLVWTSVQTCVLSLGFNVRGDLVGLDGPWPWRRANRRREMMLEICTWVRSCSSKSQRGGLTDVDGEPSWREMVFAYERDIRT